MRHDKLRFVKKLDYLTTPGYLTGPGAREEAGLPVETGPYRVISQLGVMGFDEGSKEMTLHQVHPGVTIDDVVENTSFELLLGDVIETEAPTKEELRILREEIDPSGIVIGK
jgi:acyl CoA:acetate/3-ketoacid CoA transferase beta subunit